MPDERSARLVDVGVFWCYSLVALSALITTIQCFNPRGDRVKTIFQNDPKFYQHVTPATVRRLAALAERIVRGEITHVD